MVGQGPNWWTEGAGGGPTCERVRGTRFLLRSLDLGTGPGHEAPGLQIRSQRFRLR